MATLTPAPKMQFFHNGVPLAGGKVRTYEAGSLIDLATYTDSTGGTPNANPVILDAQGRASIWLDSAKLYKFAVLDSSDVDTNQGGDNIGGVVSRNELLSSSGSSVVGFLQAGTGAVARTLQAKGRDVVSTADFGVSTGESAANNTAYMQAALNACETSGAKLIGIPGTYSINDTLTIKCDCDLSQMHFEVDATAVSTAIRVGPATAGQYLFDSDIALPFVTNTAKSGAGWVGFDTSIGVELANVYQSRITVPYVYNFGVGLKEGGYGVGCVYNTITIGVLYGNKINHQLKPGDGDGWANQNVHIGGRFGHASSEGTAVSGVKHIELRDFDATAPNAPNNNLWLNPSIEGNEQEFHLDIQGTFNTFLNPRFETGAGVAGRVNWHAVSANETANNNIIGGYDTNGITSTFSGAGTSTKNKRIGGTANDAYEFSSNGINLVNKSGSAVTAPHVQGFESSQTALSKDASSSEWIYRLHGAGISVKGAANANARIEMASSGALLLGSGSAPADAYFTGAAGTINCFATFRPGTDNAFNSGGPSNRWNTVYSVNLKITPVTVANLPAAGTIGAGGRAFVSDANATTFASVVAGGGANNIPVYSDGTNWRIG